jgi:uncharacterized protein with PIN domain
MRFFLDEDLPYSIAEIARGLGLDVVSAHELDRRGYSDEEQLRFAAGDERILVTRNRNDFTKLTRDFIQRSQPHRGVLVVPRSFPGRHPEWIARALEAWAGVWKDRDPGPYFLDFLSR